LQEQPRTFGVDAKWGIGKSGFEHVFDH
jgi:hypothetical protein